MVASRYGRPRLRPAADDGGTYVKKDGVLKYDPTNPKLMRAWRVRVEADLSDRKLLVAAKLPTPDFTTWCASMLGTSEPLTPAEQWALRGEYAEILRDDDEKRTKVFNLLVRYPGVLDSRVLDPPSAS